MLMDRNSLEEKLRTVGTVGFGPEPEAVLILHSTDEGTEINAYVDEEKDPRVAMLWYIGVLLEEMRVNADEPEEMTKNEVAEMAINLYEEQEGGDNDDR